MHYAYTTNMEFIVDTRVLSHGWLIYSYLHLSWSRDCQGSVQIGFLTTLWHDHITFRRYIMSQQKNSILINEHVLNREPVCLYVYLQTTAVLRKGITADRISLVLGWLSPTCCRKKDESVLYKHKWNTSFWAKTWYFHKTSENNMWSSHMKRSPLLWLHNKSQISQQMVWYFINGVYKLW